MRRIKELFIFFAVMIVPVWALMFVGLFLYSLFVRHEDLSIIDLLQITSVGSFLLASFFIPILFTLLWLYSKFEIWRIELVEDIRATTENDR